MNPNELRKLKDKGPYDSSMELRTTFYDNVPYVRDIDLCNQEQIFLYRSKLFKYYRCKIGDSYVVTANVVSVQ